LAKLNFDWLPASRYQFSRIFAAVLDQSEATSQRDVNDHTFAVGVQASAVAVTCGTQKCVVFQQERYFLTVSNYAFTFVFTVEMVVKVKDLF
jgi:hypothetical protein